jgi:glutamate-5-semialdehyde dehydrogenase
MNITAFAPKSGAPSVAVANSRNCAILKGGKESIHTSSLLVNVISDALAKTVIPAESISYLTSRKEVMGWGGTSLTNQL